MEKKLLKIKTEALKNPDLKNPENLEQAMHKAVKEAYEQGLIDGEQQVYKMIEKHRNNN